MREYDLSSYHRYTIVVDTSALTELHTLVSPQFRSSGEDNERRYIDALAALGKMGYEILIPEMVVYEASGMLPSGDNTDRFFDSDQSAKRRPYTGLIKFFQDLIEHPDKYPNIHIVQTAGEPRVKRWMDAMKKIADNYSPQYLKEYTGKGADARRQIVALHRDKKSLGEADPPVHFGDDAALALIDEKIRQHPNGEPNDIFLLANDVLLLKKASLRDKVHVLNSSGLIEAMAKNSMHDALDLRKDADMVELHKDRQLQKVEFSGARHKEEFLRPVDSSNKAFILGNRSSRRTRIHSGEDLNDYPFAESLAQLLSPDQPWSAWHPDRDSPDKGKWRGR